MLSNTEVISELLNNYIDAPDQISYFLSETQTNQKCIFHIETGIELWTHHLYKTSLSNDSHFDINNLFLYDSHVHLRHHNIDYGYSYVI